MNKPLRLLIFCLAFSMQQACDNSAEEEAGEAAYHKYDRDRDAKLNQQEFDAFWEDEFHQEDWDLNEDALVDEEEFAAATDKYYHQIDDRYGEFTDWDVNQDGFIGENELTRAVFIYWDEDEDGNITKTEYAKYRYDRP